MKHIFKIAATLSITLSALLTSGCFLALAGGAGYGIAKHEENKKAKAQAHNNSTPSTTNKTTSSSK